MKQEIKFKDLKIKDKLSAIIYTFSALLFVFFFSIMAMESIHVALIVLVVLQSITFVNKYGLGSFKFIKEV